MTREQRLITAGVLAGIAVSALDATVVGTAMPTIIGQLGGIERYGWVFAAYLLTATTTVPLFSTLADVRGRKPVFLVGLALFVGGSALCGLASSMPMLIAFRAIQGLGAGAVQPVAFTIIGDIFDTRQRARMQGVFSAVWGVSAIVGPALGGLITSTIGWRWVFEINVPVGLASGLLIGRFLHERVEHHRHRIDVAGAVTLTAGVALLLLAASEGGSLGWASPFTIGCLVGAVLLLATFILAERRAPEPLISTELLRRPIVAAGLAVGALAGVVMFGLTAYVPPLVQGVLGGSPLAAGLAVGTMSIGWPIGSIVSGRAILRFEVRPIVLLGCGLLLAGTGLLTHAAATRLLWYTAVATAVVGLGMGFTSTPLLVAIQTAVAWRQRGQATGLVQFSRTIGGAVGTGLLGALLAAAAGPGASAVLDPVLRAGIAADQLAAARNGLQAGLGWIFLVLVAAGAGSLLVAAWLMPTMHIGEPEGSARSPGTSEDRQQHRSVARSGLAWTPAPLIRPLARADRPEHLDEAGHDPAVLSASLAHVAQVNRWLGGRRAVRLALERHLRGAMRVLDVGTGAGDLPMALAELAGFRGGGARIVATDRHPQILAVAARLAAGRRCLSFAGADAVALPFPDRSFDVVLLSMVLHHLDDHAARQALAEAARVAPLVIVNELHRTRVNYAGARLLAATLWRGNRLTRHDGPLSVLRGYRRGELRALATAAGLTVVELRRRWFQRLVLVAAAPRVEIAP